MELDELKMNFKEITQNMLKLFMKKQKDYGSANISTFGEVGVLVRLNDKFERLKNLVMKHSTPQNESIDDTLIDIANYAVIYLMIRKGFWEDARHFEIKEVRTGGEEKDY